MLANQPLTWQPHITVAAVIPDAQGKFLVVEEHGENGICFNQPAGHLEYNESLIEAVIREVLEETRYIFSPEYLLGVYQWTTETRNKTYLRFAFVGSVDDLDENRELDPAIIACHWLSIAEINSKILRSPLVAKCFEDYFSNKRYPLYFVENLDEKFK